MAKTYKNGVQDGRTAATLEDVREDIAGLKSIMERVALRVYANTATVGLLAVAVGFLYVALIRGWF